MKLTPRDSKIYLLHRELKRCFTVRKLHCDTGALNFSHDVVQLLGLLQHLPVAATKFTKDTIGHVRNAVCRVA